MVVVVVKVVVGREWCVGSRSPRMRMLEERRRTLLDDGLGIRESKPNEEEPKTMLLLLDEFIVLDNNGEKPSF